MLVPHEHGAYGQLAFPLVTALAARRPSTGAVALAVAVFMVFLAHESLLVLLGQRGPRARREQRGRARRGLAVFGGIAIPAGLLALFDISPAARMALVIPAALAVGLVVVVGLHKERTTAGESLVAVTLSAASIPVAVASGESLAAGLTIALVFAVAFVTATISVRSIIIAIARTGGPSRITAASVALGGAAALLVLSARQVLLAVAPVAALPVLLVDAALLVNPPAPRRLRTVGWVLVGATAVTAAILIIFLRRP